MSRARTEPWSRFCSSRPSDDFAISSRIVVCTGSFDPQWQKPRVRLRNVRMMSSIGDPAMGTGGGSGPGSAALSGFVIAGSGEVKTQFMTREGLYKLVPLAEYARPNRLGPPGSASGVSIGGGGYSLSGHPGLGPPPGSGGGPGNSGAGSATGGTSNAPPPVRVSFSKDVANSKIAFNYGREIFVYPYRGLRKVSETCLQGRLPPVYDASDGSSWTCQRIEIVFHLHNHNIRNPLRSHLLHRPPT